MQTMLSRGQTEEVGSGSRLIFGTLYPAYYSYKAVKSKDIKEYVKWMMYWIIFALFTTAETFTDIFLCWFPFYYELKIAFVAWLLSPYTKGSSLLYRKFVHPTLSSKEKEIDDCLVQAKDRSYDALVHFGKRGLNVAATAAVMAASKGQGALSERLRSFSMQDLTTIRGDGAPAPSGPPPPGSGRASGKHGQPKMSRSASESASSSGRCHFTSPLSFSLGLAFIERGPVHHVECSLTLAPWTCHQQRCPPDHARSAKGRAPLRSGQKLAWRL
uniref:Receptor expression-enhancing protein n=1 Tax=Callithrix jacchus TaxID=9483 RepID=A0A8I4A1S1_CALJA